MTTSGIFTFSVSSGSGGGGGIVGSIWTPARDGSGNVTDLATLPLMTQLYVGGPDGIMNTVIQVPHLWRTPYGADSAPGIVNAWNGAGWDWVSNTMYVTGGGHSDTSMLENGIYGFNLGKMKWTRVMDRSLPSAWQQWTPTGGWNFVNTSPAAAQGDPSNGTSFSNPLGDGAPSPPHNYNQVLWIPPSVMGGGNVKGGVYQGSSTRGVCDLDLQAWRPLHFYNSLTSGSDWMSYVCAVLDGNAVLFGRGGGPLAVYKFTLAGEEKTDYPITGPGLSFGVLTSMGSAGSANGLSQKNCTHGDMRERRESVYFSGDQRAYRFRYGAMMDAGSSNWDSFTDIITLASTDGSHLDFSALALFNNDVNFPPVPGAGNLNFCGVGYAHDESALYVAPNYAGSRMYRITGLAGSTWQVQKLPISTAVLSTQAHQTYGRFRVGTVGGVKLAVRVSSTTGATEICRLA